MWWGGHLFKRLAPEKRAAMGNGGRGAVALVLVAAVVLMVMGYRSTEFIYVWAPPSFMVHINNLAGSDRHLDDEPGGQRKARC